ncbi:MAG: hypothetical protein GY810_01070 [Aureispira sp.]|nr:hypothetical protein [Aureispira sp.]
MKVHIGEYKDDNSDREVEVRIDEYDVWSLDHTLALIILPGLKMLREQSHSVPLVSSKDVPKELRRSKEDKKKCETDGTIDKNYNKRWDFVLGEMIFAFEQIVDTDSDSVFHTGVVDIYLQALDRNRDKIGVPYKCSEAEAPKGAELFEMIKGPLDTHKFHVEEYEAHHKRIKRGTKLFGKYYQTLWS